MLVGSHDNKFTSGCGHWPHDNTHGEDLCTCINIDMHLEEIEDEQETTEGLQPFMYEPEASDGNDNIEAEESPSRLDNTDWYSKP